MTVTITTNENEISWHVAFITSGICAAIAMILLSHLVYHYHQLFCKNNSEQSKTPYGLVILYLSVIIVTFSVLVTVRTNIITQINIESFTQTQCIIGFFVFWLLYIIGYVILYSIFIQRIKIVFEGSVYEYKYVVIKALYIGVALILFIHITYLVVRVYFDHDWILNEFTSSNILYCAVNLNSSNVYSLWITIHVLIFSVLNLCIQIILLYMFIRGLWLLNKEMISQFVTDYNSNKGIHGIHGQSAETPTNASVEMVLNQYESAQNTKKDTRIMSDKVKQIIELHSVIKKHTILACIAIISTIACHIFGITIRNFTVFISFVDLGVNAISVWLMLTSSVKYWLFCRKYGLCTTCYCDHSMDESIL